jgi:uncharacterized protein (DUF1697 family)
MRELVQAFTEAGCTDVETHIQTGNVVFSSDRGMDVLERSLTNRIKERFGFPTDMIVRTAAEMRETLRRNPFETLIKKETIEPKNLHVLFLKDLPNPAFLQKLNHERYAPERFAVLDSNVYLLLPNGAAQTKLTNTYFESRLFTVSTARNWNTVQNLCAMLEDSD